MITHCNNWFNLVLLNHLIKFSDVFQDYNVSKLLDNELTTFIYCISTIKYTSLSVIFGKDYGLLSKNFYAHIHKVLEIIDW